MGAVGGVELVALKAGLAPEDPQLLQHKREGGLSLLIQNWTGRRLSVGDPNQKDDWAKSEEKSKEACHSCLFPPWKGEKQQE
jgi:hypothetical protein